MRGARTDDVLPGAVPVAGNERRATSRGPSVIQLAVVLAILGSGVLVTALTSSVTQVAEPGIRLVDGKPFLVEQAGDWKGGPLEGLTEAERNILPADTEGVRRIYKDAQGHEVYCSVILEGKDVTSIHRPELCLTGQGWVLEKPRVEQIPTPAAKNGLLPVSRLNATRNIRLENGRIALARSVFLYWFVGKDRVTASHPQRIMLTTIDRVLHNRNARWAYILIHVPMAADAAPGGTDNAEKQTMQTVTKFVQDIYPTLALH
jgi:EpsI family protein